MPGTTLPSMGSSCTTMVPYASKLVTSGLMPKISSAGLSWLRLGVVGNTNQCDSRTPFAAAILQLKMI